LVIGDPTLGTPMLPEGFHDVRFAIQAIVLVRFEVREILDSLLDVGILLGFACSAP